MGSIRRQPRMSSVRLDPTELVCATEHYRELVTDHKLAQVRSGSTHPNPLERHSTTKS